MVIVVLCCMGKFIELVMKYYLLVCVWVCLVVLIIDVFVMIILGCSVILMNVLFFFLFFCMNLEVVFWYEMMMIFVVMYVCRYDSRWYLEREVRRRFFGFY